MPLPIILGGAALVAVAYGAKKGNDGRKTKTKAEFITQQAQKDYQQAKIAFDRENEKTINTLDELGSLQLKIGSDFASFRKIADNLLKQINKTGQHRDLKLSLPKHQLDRIKNLEFSSMAYLSQVAGAGAAGGAAAFAVYGGVMSLAAASTGTPIAALSGAAAYNATMAAIGGGSLAAGGLGMAGGAMVLGGVVAAPILAVAGWAYNAHAEKALSHAYKTSDQVDEAMAKMELARQQFQKTSIYVSKIQEATQKIYVIFLHYLDDLKEMDAFISNNANISQIEDKTIQVIENGYKIAAILTDIICTPLFKLKTDENGQIVLDEDSSVQIEIDENGLQILNTAEIDKNLSQADIDMKPFERFSA